MKFLAVVALLLFISCASSTQTPAKEGLAELRLIVNVRLPDSIQQTIITQKIWYKNNLAIEEVKSTATVTDQKGVSVSNNPISYFRYNDLDKKQAFLLSSFEADPSVIDQYTYASKKGIEMQGGFGFHEKKEMTYYSSPTILSDTVEAGVKTKRLRIQQGSEGQIVWTDLFFSCRFPWIFDMASNLSRQQDCPCTKAVSYAAAYGVESYRIELVLLRDYLTPAEQKIFAAWKKKFATKS